MSKRNRGLPDSQRFKINRLLTCPDRKVDEATNILSKLYRITLAELNIGVELYNRMVSKWLNDPANGMGKCPSKKSSARGNLNKEVLRPDMSPNVFLKALNVTTGAEDVELVLRIKRKGHDNYTEHYISVENLSEYIAHSSNREGIEDEEVDDRESGTEPVGYRRQGKNSVPGTK